MSKISESHAPSPHEDVEENDPSTDATEESDPEPPALAADVEGTLEMLFSTKLRIHSRTASMDDAAPNEKECHFMIVWEVTFYMGENVLSSVATEDVWQTHGGRTNRESFAKSVRRGLNEILTDIGFSGSNSRSGHISKLPMTERVLNQRLAGFDCQTVHQTRAKKWIERVTRFNVNHPVTLLLPPPALRPATNPFYVVRVEGVVRVSLH